MSASINETPFIFYLVLEEELPPAFYQFDRQLKARGFMLVPVRIDQLQGLLATAEQTQTLVICSVTNSREIKAYNQRVRKFLKYILKTRSLTFLLMTSFSKINDVVNPNQYANYYLLKYPLDAAALSDRIVQYYTQKSEINTTRWPGGKRAGIKTISI